MISLFTFLSIFLQIVHLAGASVPALYVERAASVDVESPNGGVESGGFFGPLVGVIVRLWFLAFVFGACARVGVFVVERVQLWIFRQILHWHARRCVLEREIALRAFFAFFFSGWLSYFLVLAHQSALLPLLWIPLALWFYRTICLLRALQEDPLLNALRAPVERVWQQQALFERRGGVCPSHVAHRFRVRAQSLSYQLEGAASSLGIDVETMHTAFDVAEGVLTLCYQLNSAQNHKDRAVAVAAFLRPFNTHEGKRRAIVVTLSDKLLAYAHRVFAPGDLEVQGFLEHVEGAKSSLYKWKTLRQSEGAEKIYRFMMYALTLGLFSKVGYDFRALGFSKAEELAARKQFRPGVDLIESVLEMTLFVCTAGYQLMQGHSIDRILHTPDAYRELYDDVLKIEADLKEYEEFASVSDLSHTRLMSRCSTIIGQLDDVLAKSCGVINHAERKVLRGLMERMSNVRLRLLSSAECMRTRQTPFSFLLYGESGVGKSSVMDVLIAAFARQRQLDPNPAFRYTLMPNQSFWNGFKSDMWCLKLDDVAALNPKGSIPDASLVEILHIVNNVPYTPDQAALENKGKTPLRVHLVVGTTNVKHLNAAFNFSKPQAILRRFPYVVSVMVKPEHRASDGQLRVSQPLDFPDYWVFKVEEVRFQGHEVRYEQVAVGDMKVLLRWYAAAIEAFYAKQSAAMDSIKSAEECAWCDGCHLPRPLCDCRLEQQSLVSDANVFLCTVMCCVTYIFAPLLHRVVNVLAVRYAYRLAARRVTVQWWAMWAKATSVSHGVKALWARHKIFGECMGELDEHQARDAMCTLGERVRSRVIGTPVLFVSLAAFLIIWLKLKGWGSLMEAQGPFASLPQERANAYATAAALPIERSTFPATGKCKTVDLDSLCNKVRSNVVHLRFEAANGVATCGRALAIATGFYITNAHTVPKVAGLLSVVVGKRLTQGIAQQKVHRFNPASDVVYHHSKDLVLLRLPGIDPKVDIREFFLDGNPKGPCYGRYLDMSEDGERKNIDMRVRCFGNVHVPGLGELFAAEGVPENVTVQGQCGMPLVCTSGSNASIVGLHAFGAREERRCGAMVVLRSDIDYLLRGELVVGASAPELSAQSAERALTSVSPKCVLNYLDQGVATVYGSFVGGGATHKSNVRPTVYQQLLLDSYGFEVAHAAPVMKGWRPWAIAAEELVQPVQGLDNAIVRACGAAYLADVLRRLPKDWQRMVAPCDVDTAVNGQPGITYVDAMKWTTSAGAPWRKSKAHYIERSVLPDGSVYVRPTEEILQRVELIWERYRRGELFRPVFTAHLKDEPVSLSKAAAAKTRVFCGSPFDWSIVVRQLFIGTIRLIHTRKFDFECAVGVVAQCNEWGKARAHVVRFGEERVVAGDYKAYDKRMPPELVLQAYDILISLAIRSGNFTQEQLLAMKCVAVDTAFPLVDYNGDLIGFWGSNPSGHPLTVIINSIVNSLYVRYAYAQSGHDVRYFADNVALLTYGDDNIMSVSEQCHGFDHTVLQRELAAIGVVYTMADKEAESVPFVSLSQATFLKRSWRWDEEVEEYLAPLEESSFQKMLLWSVASKTETAEVQDAACLLSAHAEFFHFGREVFTQKDAMVRDVLSRTGLSAYLSGPLKSFEDYCEAFHSASNATNLVWWGEEQKGGEAAS